MMAEEGGQTELMMTTQGGGAASIAEAYAGRSIFITGATGFMGKIMVEKLLRECADIGRLYLLIRAKKGIEPSQRKEEYIRNIVFDHVREKHGDRLSRIHLIRGDILSEGLGLSESDHRELIDNVEMVFHCAANVRFDQHIRQAVDINLNGTIRVLKLAEQMRKLVSFVHVSTSYCQCNEAVLEEKYYPAPQNPEGISQMVGLLDDNVLDLITPRLLNNLPNTYAYTKALTEDMVYQYRGKLPIAIARPSIVTAAMREPLPGWGEGTNGPTGLLIGAGRGVIRSMHCKPSYLADLMPVDLTMNGIIAIGKERMSNPKKDDVMYYNLTSSSDNPINWGEVLETGRKVLYENPFCFALWYPDGSIKSNYFYHWLCVIFFHYLPAYLIDFLMIVLRRKPFLVKVQKRISGGLTILQYYTTKQWIFQNNNFKSLYQRLSEADRKRFYCDVTEINYKTYLHDFILGARQYIVKEAPETLPKARKLLRKLYVMDKIVQIGLYLIGLWFVWTYIEVVTGSIQFVFDSVIDRLRTSMHGHDTSTGSNRVGL
ncbi:putative fatty acyl-CoA reductase CG5065 isoform X2 [Anopheles albimanus]|uniref:Fatty acyl-CoA reductase n=2 Tax=Anopheles albimanus TaxID=7167 RepID=A0A182FBM8_ANOAL|nr:putative fatty acyl-CoA reductase CG5065 isoform X2 [Anopheles albimanus]XP_035773856.1 putative fatty acyl-CoA reductase CG5065 isoform X2 [Anopheles albimanus]XP_035773857.1 putative fatty acyl-CoA reductase CG5065 isoform X2 [Anopheles albimanus]